MLLQCGVEDNGTSVMVNHDEDIAAMAAQISSSSIRSQDTRPETVLWLLRYQDEDLNHLYPSETDDAMHSRALSGNCV